MADNQLITKSYASGNVTNSAYTSIGTTNIAFNNYMVSDTSGALMKLAYSKDGGTTKIDLNQIPVNGTALLSTPSVDTVPVGSTLYLKSIDTATVSTGFNAITLMV